MQATVVFPAWLLLALLSSSVDAFQPLRPYPQTQQSNRAALAVLKSSSKDEEIARLEEQLRRLKEEAPAEEVAAAAEQLVIETEGDLPEDFSDREKLIELFLTEKWKEEEAVETPSEEGGLGLVGILGAFGLAAFLAFFSQVPVGQEDLSKYSAIKAPSEQIDLGDLNRARNAGDL